MKKFKTTLLATSIVSLLSIAASQTAVAKQATVDSMSKQLQVNYKVVDNHAANNGVDCSSLGADWGACNKATISLKNVGSTINDKDWAIYFHDIRMILAVENDQFKISQITGDLHKIEPTEKFSGFPANKTIEIPIIGEYWQVSQSDVIPRWYVTSTDAKPKIIANTDTEDLSAFVSPIGDQWKRTPDDHNILMTPVTRFALNADVQKLDSQLLRGQILPTPTMLTVGKTDVIIGSNGVNLVLNGLNNESLAVLTAEFKKLNVPVSANGFNIQAKIDAGQFKNGVSGAYKLNIGEKGATIVAYDESGIFLCS